MSVAVKLATTNALVIDGETGKVFVNFDDGTQFEYEDAADLSQRLASKMPEQEMIRHWLVLNRLAGDPAMDSPTYWNGKQLTVDLEKVSAPDVFKIV